MRSFVMGHPQELPVDVFVRMAMIAMGEEIDVEEKEK